MKAIPLILCLAAPALADGNALALWLLEQEQATPKVERVDFDRTAAFNKLLREQSPPGVLPGAKPPVVATPPAPAALTPKAKVSPTPTPKAPAGHWETRTRYVKKCFGTYCKLVPVASRVWVADKPAKAWPVYPSRSVSGSRWKYNGGRITAAHLADPHGHHSHEHFSRAWLNTLNQDQLTALGSDAHEGRVREKYVVRDR